MNVIQTHKAGLNSEVVRVLHIDTEFGWRGGQQQVAYLVAGMRRQGYEAAVVCQPGSDMERYCRNQAWACHPRKYVPS